MKNVMVKNNTNGMLISFPEMMAEGFAQDMGALGYEMKIYEAGKVPFEALPSEVKNEVMYFLEVYSKVNVVFANGKFNVSTGVAIMASYVEDDCLCGEYFAKDLFTEEERKANYEKNFGFVLG